MRNLLIALSAIGASQVAYSESEACMVGPWSISGNRDSVQAISDQGPFVPVKATGGIETFNATISGVNGNVSFVFGRDDQLSYIQYFAVEGDDIAVARSKFIEFANKWSTAHGGYKVGSFRIGNSDILPASAASDLFKATVEVPLDSIMKAASQSNEPFVANLLFHATPAKQPDECSLHILYGHMGQTKTFFVYYFVDKKDYVRSVPPTGVSIVGPGKKNG